jgi:hypothetical protein
MKGLTMITKFPRITEHVVKYPITGDYDINIWCDNDGTEEPVVNLTFYPLVRGEEYDTVDTSTFYTLALTVTPRGPRQKEALNYLKALVNEEDTFDMEYTDWWSNECVLVNPPQAIAEFIAGLPRNGVLTRFVTGE